MVSTKNAKGKDCGVTLRVRKRGRRRRQLRRRRSAETQQITVSLLVRRRVGHSNMQGKAASIGLVACLSCFSRV